MIHENAVMIAAHLHQSNEKQKAKIKKLKLKYEYCGKKEYEKEKYFAKGNRKKKRHLISER